MGKDVATLKPSFLIGSSFWQVTRTTIKLSDEFGFEPNRTL